VVVDARGWLGLESLGAVGDWSFGTHSGGKYIVSDRLRNIVLLIIYLATEINV